jgi:hypothetical protein
MYFLTVLLHYALGVAILRRLGLRSEKWEMFGLAFPLGLGSASLLIFLLDVLGIRLTFFSITLVCLAVFLLLIFPDFANFRKLKNLQLPKFAAIKRVSPVEWLFLMIIAAFFFISAWRCFYLPVTPYDAIVGIDLLAKYAAEDGRINSRIFHDLQGELSTQPYYAPFAALSQAIYRLAGFAQGQVWLSFMTLSLLVIFYGNLRREIHPLPAGFLTVVLIAVPEMYAYTYLLQTDFSNAVFASLSMICAFRFIQKEDARYFWVSALLFGFAAWTRSETVAFSLPAAGLLFLFLLKKKTPLPFKYPLLFFGVSLFFFAIWNLYYLPVVLDYRPESFFKFGFWDPERLFLTWKGMFAIMKAEVYWGYVPHIFVLAAVINLAIFRDRDNLFILLWIILLYLGFLILLYHLQLSINANINFTFRRGTFKLWPMMVFYIGSSGLVKHFSTWLTNWEGK